MYKSLIKNILILTLPISTFGSDFAYSHKKFDTTKKVNIESKIQDNIKYQF